MASEAVREVRIPAGAVALEGELVRREATGRGLMVVCDEALQKLNKNRDQTRVIIRALATLAQTPLT